MVPRSISTYFPQLALLLGLLDSPPLDEEEDNADDRSLMFLTLLQRYLRPGLRNPFCFFGEFWINVDIYVLV